MFACEGLIKLCLDETAGVPGDIAEIGVYKGESAIFIAENTTGKLVLFDTFAGMPKEMVTLPMDSHNAESFGDTSLQHCEHKLSRFNGRIDFRPGVFPRTACESDGPFRFVHIDVDLYLSTKAALEFAYRRLSPGGRILCDDYCESTQGSIKAIDEFRRQHPEFDARIQSHRVIIQHKEAPSAN